MLSVAQRRSSSFVEIQQLTERPQILLGLPRGDAIQIGEEQQHLAHREPGIDAVARRHQPDPRLHFVGRLAGAKAGDLGIAVVRLQQADDHADRRRLARAVGAQQAVDFARPHRKRQPIDGQDLASAAVESFA